MSVAGSVLADTDDVPVAKGVLLHQFPVDEGSVRAVEILEERVVQDGDDRRVMAADRQVVDMNVVVRLAADSHALLVERILAKH